MFKHKLFKTTVLTLGLTMLSIGLSNNSVQATTTETNDSDLIYQPFPIDYLNSFLDNLNDNVTIPSYELAEEVDGYYRTFDQFVAGDMPLWLGEANTNYAKATRNDALANHYKYRLSPADDDFWTFKTQTVPDLKKNGGTAQLKLQILNNFNYSQTLIEKPITITVPALNSLNVDFQDTITTTNATPNVFTNIYQIPNFTITDSQGKTYQAKNIAPVSNVYQDGKKVAISALPKTLKAGTYAQSIFFDVSNMSQAELKLLSTNGLITGNNGNDTIRYSNGQLIAARTVIVK
ncbi:hypothetical protein [Companilactobacillus furfuricola]|uniref:hypothetical protein n=1 Tax=Companilactobacillus furfuricola TaxID=1462575 RepID=UPI000F7B1EB0|nr:hypothetical protein [Companilactobacillus furfuricola]